MRLPPVAIPHASNRHVADAEMAAQGASAPMGGISGSGLQGGVHDPLDEGFFAALHVWWTRGLMLQASHSSRLEALAPKDHRGTRSVQLLGDLAIGFAFVGQQADARAERHLLGCRRSTHPRLQLTLLFAA